MNRDTFNNNSILRLVSDYEVDSEYDSSLEDGECQSPTIKEKFESNHKSTAVDRKEVYYLFEKSELENEKEKEEFEKKNEGKMCGRRLDDVVREDELGEAARELRRGRKAHKEEIMAAERPRKRGESKAEAGRGGTETERLSSEGGRTRVGLRSLSGGKVTTDSQNSDLQEKRLKHDLRKFENDIYGDLSRINNETNLEIKLKDKKLRDVKHDNVTKYRDNSESAEDERPYDDDPSASREVTHFQEDVKLRKTEQCHKSVTKDNFEIKHDYLKGNDCKKEVNNKMLKIKNYADESKLYNSNDKNNEESGSDTDEGWLDMYKEVKLKSKKPIKRNLDVQENEKIHEKKKSDYRKFSKHNDMLNEEWFENIEQKLNVSDIIKSSESVLSKEYYNVDDNFTSKESYKIPMCNVKELAISNIKIIIKDKEHQVSESKLVNEITNNDDIVSEDDIYKRREKEEKLLREKLVRAYNERKRKSSETDETVYKSLKIVEDAESVKVKQHTKDHSYTDTGLSDIYQDEYIPRSKFDSTNSVSDDENVIKIQENNEVTVTDVKKDIDNTGIYYPAKQGCRLLSNYEFLNKIEEGTYGEVFRARDKHTREIVALKRLKMENEKYGFPITSLREVNTLMKAQHENIVTVREVVVGRDIDKIYLVMDFVEHDLKSFMRVIGRQMTIAEVKCLMLQLLAAIAHLHDNWIIHRDIKTSNLLLSHNGILKVADFGLAREYGSPLKSYTNLVVTLWYRAPELLLGQKIYSTHIDMWSVGCIFGEMLLHRAMFAGKSESEQIHILFRELGVPTEEVWPGVSDLPIMKKINYKSKEKPRNDKKLATRLSNSGKYVMNKLLTYCPERRFTAEEAKKHYYFSETPLAIHPSQFPKFPAKSETIPKKIVPVPKRIFN